VSDQVSFYTKDGDQAETFDVKLSTSGKDPSDFTEILAADISAPADYEEFTYDISAYEGEDVYIAVIATSTNEYYIYLDDFVVETIPSCMKPTDLTVDGLTTTTADVSWTAGADETEWTAIYGEPGFDPEEEGTEISVTDDPETTLDNLDPSTTYEVYVRANCSESDESEWEGPLSFATNCEATDIPFTQD